MDRSKALFGFNSTSDTVLSTRGRAIAAQQMNVMPHFLRQCKLHDTRPE